jgi:hypothetical protein
LAQNGKPSNSVSLEALDQTNVFGLRVLKTTISLLILSVSHLSSPGHQSRQDGQDVGGPWLLT